MPAMNPFLSLNTGALGLGGVALDEAIRLATTHGFGGIDVSVGSAQEADVLRVKLAASRLRAGMFGSPCNLYAEDAAFEQGLARLAEVAPHAARAGVVRTGCYMLCAHAERSYAENLKWHLSRLRRMVNVLRPHGIELGIEFLGEHLVAKIGKHPFIHDLRGMRELLFEIGPGAGVIFDVFHWYCSGGTVQALAEELQGISITSVHLNDAVAERGRLEQIDNERRLPLETGVIDVRGAMRVIRQTGYSGPVMVEPFKPWTQQLPAMGADAACAKIAGIVKPLLEA